MDLMRCFCWRTLTHSNPTPRSAPPLAFMEKRMLFYQRSDSGMTLVTPPACRYTSHTAYVTHGAYVT